MASRFGQAGRGWGGKVVSRQAAGTLAAGCCRGIADGSAQRLGSTRNTKYAASPCHSAATHACR